MNPTDFIEGLRPVPEAPPARLVVHNPHLGGLTRISIDGVIIGEAKPATDIVLYGVRHGLYEVTFTTYSGAIRSRSVETEPATTRTLEGS